MTEIRVVLADHHPVTRVGVRTTLTTEKDIALVGEADSVRELQRLCQDLKPDVLLLDIKMLDSQVIHVASYLRGYHPEIRVLVWTAYEDDVKLIRSLVEMGIAGYILKDEAADEVVRSIRNVMNGGSCFSWSIEEKLIQSDVYASTQAALYGLNERDQRILRLIAEGRDNDYIASSLHLANQTVRNYVSCIYSKLGVRSRIEAALWATEHISVCKRLQSIELERGKKPARLIK